MNSWKKVMVLVSVAALCLTANDLMAQGRRNAGGGGGGGAGGGAGGGFGGGGGGGGGRRGNFDPAQARQRQMDNYKQSLEVTDDGEWKVLETAIGKVLDAQQELRTAESSPFGRGGRNRGGGGGAGGADPTATATAGGGGGGGGGGRPGFTPLPEMEALQQAVDAKAPSDEIKAKLGKLRDVVKAREIKLAGARDDLRKLLSTRQEATSVLMGLLK
jgi:hypothetical protein